MYKYLIRYHRSPQTVVNGVSLIRNHTKTEAGKPSKYILTQTHIDLIQPKIDMNTTSCLPKHQYTITKYSWYIKNLQHVGRPPLRSYVWTLACGPLEEEGHTHSVRECRNWPRFCVRSRGWKRHPARVGSPIALRAAVRSNGQPRLCVVARPTARVSFNSPIYK